MIGLILIKNWRKDSVLYWFLPWSKIQAMNVGKQERSYCVMGELLSLGATQPPRTQVLLSSGAGILRILGSAVELNKYKSSIENFEKAMLFYKMSESYSNKLKFSTGL